MFDCRCFFFLTPRHRAPSADRRETFPHDRNMGVLYNASPKIRGPFSQRNWGPKTCEIRRDFRQLSDFDREYLRNGTRYPKSENVSFPSDSSRVPQKVR